MIQIKDLINQAVPDKDARPVRNHLFSRTNLQGYNTLKQKYLLKNWQGSTLDQTAVSFRNKKSKPLDRCNLTMDNSPDMSKRQVSFERFDFTKIPIQDQEKKSQEPTKGKAILKSPSSK